MKRLQKVFLAVTLGIGCAVFFVGAGEAWAATSEVYVEAKESQVGNLYYEIIKDGERVVEELKFLLKDEHGNVVISETIENGIIWKKEIPFEKYTIVIRDGEEYHFSVSVDKEYLKTQHILKKLVLKKEFVKTGDYAEPELFWLMCTIALIIVSGVFTQKKRSNR